MNNNIDFMLSQEDMKKWRSPEDDMVDKDDLDGQLKELEKLENEIKRIEISYDYEDTYSKLINACVDYENRTSNYLFEYLFENYFNYESVEEIAKQELEKGGLERLQCFLGSTRFYNEEIFKINAYGNLENIDKEELEYLKEEIIYIIDKELE